MEKSGTAPPSDQVTKPLFCRLMLHYLDDCFSNIRTRNFAVVLIRDDFKASALSSSISNRFSAPTIMQRDVLMANGPPRATPGPPLASVQYSNWTDQRGKKNGNGNGRQRDRQTKCMRASLLLSFDRAAEMLRLFQHTAPARR